MSRRFIGIVLAAGLGLGFAASGSVALADEPDPNQRCGGNYAATVEAETVYYGDGQGIGYCSDGTFEGLMIPADGDGTSSCGNGEHPAAVEVEQIEPAGISYCSDGTFEGLEDPPL
jgi:hypothetical protein